MTKPTAVIDPIQQRLAALTQETPDLAPMAELYQAILPLLRDANLRVEPIALTQDQARAKLDAGLPLLHDIDLPVDDQSFCDLMLRLARAIEAIRPDPVIIKRRSLFARRAEPNDGDATKRKSAAHQIRLALEQNQIDSSELVSHIAAGDRDGVVLLVQSLQLDADLLWTIAQNAFKPALRTWARQLELLAQDDLWDKGYCFICGARATFAELQGNDQEQHLRCDQCGADWRYPRLKCVYCGNEDHQTLSQLFPVTHRDRQHIQVCDQCHGYLKVIAAFSPTPVELLTAEDLATLHLDYIAQQRGYARITRR